MRQELPLVDGDTFILDNSRYEYIMYCMREAEYGVIHGRIPGGINAALVFGEALHLALKYRYLYCDTAPVSEDHQLRQFLLLEKFFETHPQPIGDHRTMGFSQLVIEAYNSTYQQEPFEILQTREGKRVVEEGFSIPLGQVGRYKIVWKGRIDLGVKERNGAIWTFDNKSTTMSGEYFLDEYHVSNQMKGYTFSLKHLFPNLEVQGAVINSLVCRKITKTGKGIEFIRSKFMYDDDIIAEWQHNTLELIGDFIHSYERGYFPMQTTQCVRKWGRCPYMSVCVKNPKTRFQDLYSTDFRDDVFDPLHEDALDLEKIRTMELPPGYARSKQITPMVEVAPDMPSLMKDLLG